MDRKSGETMRLLNRYYDTLLSRKEWREILADDFLLAGTVAKESRGRDSYVNNNFFSLVEGVKVKETLVVGESAFALVKYDLISPKGKTMTCDIAELWKARNGRLASIAIFFDTAAFRAFLA
jgi:ketosteroid isomerase-like protein